MTNPHLALLEKAEALLRPLPRKFVFVGGATVSLHLDDQVTRARATRDVDFVIEAASYAENAMVEEELRRLGFVQNVDRDDPICRWHKEGLALDMMPTDPTILGFGESRWFEEGFASAKTYQLPNGRKIHAFDALHLIAAKIEAYLDRGQDDWLTSPDVEDIVTVIDGRTAIFDEFNGDGELEDFIRRWLSGYSEDELREIIGSHLSDYARGEYLHECLIEIVLTE